MVKYGVLIIVFLGLFSCNKKVEIIELPLLSYKSSNVKDGKLFYYSSSSFLIKNVSNDDEVKKIILNYKVNANDRELSEITYTFYKYTSITKTFLEKKYYIPFFSGVDESLLDQRDAYLGSIYYDRCENDTTKWESSISIKYNKKDADIEVKENEDPYYYRREVLESCY